MKITALKLIYFITSPQTHLKNHLNWCQVNVAFQRKKHQKVVRGFDHNFTPIFAQPQIGNNLPLTSITPLENTNGAIT